MKTFCFLIDNVYHVIEDALLSSKYAAGSKITVKCGKNIDFESISFGFKEPTCKECINAVKNFMRAT